jgi:hypothetical protein
MHPHRLIMANRSPFPQYLSLGLPQVVCEPATLSLSSERARGRAAIRTARSRYRPAAPANVVTQSSAEKISLISMRGGTKPGHRTIAGTR